MSVEEQLQEHAEKAKQPFERRVAVTMALIAAVLAFVSVTGHLYTTEEIIHQQRAADQWAFGQAKNIRRYQSEVAVDLLNAVTPGRSLDLLQKYKTNLTRYEQETEENQRRARELEKERDTDHSKAIRLHLGEVFLEMGIVLASVAILTKRTALWWMCIATSTAGVVVAASMLTIR